MAYDRTAPGVDNEEDIVSLENVVFRILSSTLDLEVH
jgi:hypothetical protein